MNCFIISVAHCYHHMTSLSHIIITHQLSFIYLRLGHCNISCKRKAYRLPSSCFKTFPVEKVPSPCKFWKGPRKAPKEGIQKAPWIRNSHHISLLAMQQSSGFTPPCFSKAGFSNPMEEAHFGCLQEIDRSVTIHISWPQVRTQIRKLRVLLLILALTE